MPKPLESIETRCWWSTPLPFILRQSVHDDISGTHFGVRTDHESLRWLWRVDNKRVARWALALQEFTFQIEYREGTKQGHVDIFTRDVPVSAMEDALSRLSEVLQRCAQRGLSCGHF